MINVQGLVIDAETNEGIAGCVISINGIPSISTNGNGQFAAYANVGDVLTADMIGYSNQSQTIEAGTAAITFNLSYISGTTAAATITAQRTKWYKKPIAIIGLVVIAIAIYYQFFKK